MKLDENQVNSILEHTANWEEQNRVAIDYYNKRVKKEALFSDNFRSF
ncbi:MAG: type II toxin-antitoxin system CcdA family antitoxin [Patescibacteria group bacterium]